MKHRRQRYLLNGASLGVLAIALYLNFVKKETTDTTVPAGAVSTTGTLAVKPAAKQTTDAASVANNVFK